MTSNSLLILDKLKTQETPGKELGRISLSSGKRQEPLTPAFLGAIYLIILLLIEWALLILEWRDSNKERRDISDS